MQRLAVMYPIARGREVLRLVRDYMHEAREELAVIVVYVSTPDSEELPKSARDVDVRT